MAVPIFAAVAKAVLPGLIGSLFGKKGNDQGNQMQFRGANRTTIGNVTGQPQQAPAASTDQSMSIGAATGQQPSQQAPSGPSGFQNFQSKAGTIANILGMLKGSGSGSSAPYQTQMRGRR